MAIDPPYRLDPFRNIINVHWGQPDWWNPQTYDFTPLYYCSYAIPELAQPQPYNGSFDGNKYGYPAGEPLPDQFQTRFLPNLASGGSTDVAGRSASITLTLDADTIVFTFDLSDIYPQYSQTSDPFETRVSSGGGYDVYMITTRLKWDYQAEPYKLYDSLFSWSGTLAVIVPTRRTNEIVSWTFLRHED